MGYTMVDLRHLNSKSYFPRICLQNVNTLHKTSLGIIKTLTSLPRAVTCDQWSL